LRCWLSTSLMLVTFGDTPATFTFVMNIVK
jgi:hypothetical protein